MDFFPYLCRMLRTTKLLLLLLTGCFAIVSPAAERLTSFKLNSENGLPDNNIRYIHQDSTGCMQFLSLYAAYQYDGYSFRRLPNDDFLRLKAQSQHISPGGKGYILDNQGNKVLTEQGETIVYIDRNTGEQIPMRVFTEQLLRLNRSLKCCVVTDRFQNIWVSVNGNGLFVYHRSEKVLYHVTKGDGRNLIDANYIVYMMEDRDGNIWLSQEHLGLVCLKVKSKNYRVMNIGNADTNEKENEVRMVSRLADGTLLIANGRGTLMKGDANLQSVTVVKNQDYNYGSAALDGEGRLWLGSTLKGVSINGKWYGSGRVDYILKDSRGRMWLCGIDGALKQAEVTPDGKYQERLFLTGIKGLGPRTMHQDHNGTIWLGTDKGLFSFNPDELLKNPKQYKQVTDIPVRSILEDSSHRLWVGTVGKGLGELQQDGTFRYLNRSNGLPNDVVQLLIEDIHHHISIGTENGLANYDPKTGVVRTLYIEDTKSRNFYNEDCCAMLADGSLAFGSLDGIVIIRHDAVPMQQKSRQVGLTDLLVNGVSVYDMGEESPLTGSLSTASSITLAHDQNSLTLHFSSFDFGDTRRSLYTYILEGYDEEWSVNSDVNFATYKNLKPRTYIFRVKCHVEGESGKEGFERILTIVVSPPWWATWWAYLIYFFLGVGIVYAVYKQLRHIEHLRQRIAVEQQLTDFKLKFFTNISHEFRTPLTLIQGAMEKMSEVKEVPGAFKQPLSNMRQSTDRMLRLVNQFLEFRRMQNNKLGLTLQETDIVQFVYNIYIGFHDMADNRRISYTFTPFQQSFSLFIDRGHVDKMVYNLLSNAFKYTPEQGSVVLKVRKQDDDHLQISVEDTGIGVAEEKRAELFDRFSTGRVSGDSLGIGLNLAQELAHVHHGEITYQENTPKGSIFTITLPISKEEYQATDFMKTDTGLKEDRDTEKEGFTIGYRDVKVNPLNERRILVVDDSEDIRQLIQNELSVYFEVDTAKDGEEALAKLHEANGSREEDENEEQHPYELVISDVKMPQIGGFELTRRIRADKSLSGLPIILLSSLAGDENLQKGLDLGADAVMEKPFSIKALIARVLNLVDQRNRLKQIYSNQPQQSAKPELVKADVDKKFVMQLDAFIDSHIADYNLSVDMLTEHFHLGRTTFFSKVRALTGSTPNDYIRDKRLSKAAELLRDNIGITVSEVAYQTGFSNAQYLSVSFKKKFGMSPSVYQKGK